MNAQEFKTIHPDKAHLEGNELWDAMEDAVLIDQNAEEIIRQIKPIWKTHTLRWLFYRRPSSIAFDFYGNDRYSSKERCVFCKKGIVSRWSFVIMDFSSKKPAQEFKHCQHCSKVFTPEPNTNISHYLFLILRQIDHYFWKALSFIRLVRTSQMSRYDMFGDEGRYVDGYKFEHFTLISTIHSKRKWWEYILIVKPKRLL